MDNYGTTTMSTNIHDIEIPTYVTLSDTGEITIDISSTGTGTVNGDNAKLILTPTDNVSSLSWVCTSTGSDLNKELTPGDCTYIS